MKCKNSAGWYQSSVNHDIIQ